MIKGRRILLLRRVSRIAKVRQNTVQVIAGSAKACLTFFGVLFCSRSLKLFEISESALINNDLSRVLVVFHDKIGNVNVPGECFFQPPALQHPQHEASVS